MRSSAIVGGLALEVILAIALFASLGRREVLADAQCTSNLHGMDDVISDVLVEMRKAFKEGKRPTVCQGQLCPPIVGPLDEGPLADGPAAEGPPAEGLRTGRSD